MIARAEITGLVLAGGRGSRMGGVDKGLQPYRGVPLAQHAMQRLAPQVGRVMINANRHLDIYAGMGSVVCPDGLPDYPGPLAGFLAGLEHCETPYLATVPCDSPLFPEDLVARLALALAEADAEIAMAVAPEHGELRAQPVFCLLKSTLKASLAEFTASGQHKVGRWTSLHRCVEVRFDDPLAFFNANTPDDLRQLHPAASLP